MESLATTKTGTCRQLRLLSLETGLSQRLGAAYFRSVPTSPGVYQFYDAAETLLYIGQSGNLCARIGSYRHVSPEKNPRRTLRLVHRIARIEWRVCATAAEAIELERVLLLSHRPPFNRAGVWEGPPWWLSASGDNGLLAIHLTRQPAPAGGCVGALPSGFRYVHAALARCVFRLSHATTAFNAYPLGLLNSTAPLALSWPADNAADLAALVLGFAAGDDALLARLAHAPPAANPSAQEFWIEQEECLQRFARKRPRMTGPSPAAQPSALPLFPLLQPS